MASSSTSSNEKCFKYQVFLSFRGEDTRKNFVDHLYNSLTRQGIHTFRDNEELKKGKPIDDLLDVIEESKFFIIVFSKDYASSSWCLKELAKIMECQDGKEQIAYPLFYDVDPSDIRKRSGPVGEAIAKAIAKDETNEQRWNKALEEAGNLVGWDLKNVANGHEAEAIHIIVKEISLKLHSIYLSKDEDLVGMESRMQVMESFIEKGINDEDRMIGIVGMGGIGKTTLARAIFRKMSSEFDGISFVENVREASKERGGLLSLQRQVLRDVLGDDSMNGVQDPISMMKLRMPGKKVLLVLDDVDHKDQLEALAGAWFKGGSRIIITTRNEQVLRAHRVNKDRIHDIDFLSDEEAISLFNRYAFERYVPDEGYEDLSFKVVKYAAGLPLTLKVLGSSLLGKKKDAWEDTIKRLDTIPEKETLGKLEISYADLDGDQKQIFLDVACFMNRFREKDAIRMLESCGFYAVSGLMVLEERSLIKISNGVLGMHDLIEEMGRNIVRRSHPREPNKHSRLWIPKEIEALFSDDEVTEATATCIRLESSDLSPEIIMKGLVKLKNLRFLHICGRYDDRPRDNRMFDQYSFPNSLQFLKWESYPGRYLPQSFRAVNLVGLELPNSRITKLWESEEGKALSDLKFLDLSYSKLRNLDLGMAPNLERLVLQGCHDLTRLNVRAECLKRLVYLYLIDCSRFRSSSFIRQLESFELFSLPKLEVIVASSKESSRYARDNLPKLSFRCLYREEQASPLKNSQKSFSLELQPGKKLESVSGSFFGLQHLRQLTLDGRIPELPNDLGQLAYLEVLNLVSTDIKCLPDSICMLKQLKSLKIKSCHGLEELPRDLGWLVSLERLLLCSASIKYLPDSICMLKNIKSLELQSCRFLKQLPRDLGQLESLEKLILIECNSLEDIPNSICNIKRLRYFCLPHCTKVENLPEELGSLEHLKLLYISYTGITHLPQSISSLEGLRIHGSKKVFQSCASVTEIQFSYSDFTTFCYIQAVVNRDTETGLENQFTKNNRHEAEAEAIDLILKEMSSIRLSKDDDNYVGMESRMQDLESSLGKGFDDEVRMIGIKGLGGSGKTTLATTIFQHISSQFDGKSFVSNVREASKRCGGLLSLQKQVIENVLGDVSMNSVQEAISMMKERMPLKKVLLVLDDVDHIDQLEALAGDWFKDGSRIIVTTRDKKVLLAHGVNAKWIHGASLLSDEEAMSLFCRYAFRRLIPDQGYEELSSQVVRYAAGLPLRIKDLGSLLSGKEELEWIDTLKRREMIPEKYTLNASEISFVGLENDQKEIFLDVACFMKGMLKEDAIRMLESRGFHAIIGLAVLEDRSLIMISNGAVGMHNSIEELGRNIVRREHPHEPNKHSRLWIKEEIEALLSDDEFTEATARCIRLESSDLIPEIIMKGLGKLKNLRFLHISGRYDDCLRDNWMFDQDNFPNELRFLKWDWYPCRSLPQTLQANHLVGLELPKSNITQLWESGDGKVLKKLRFLDLSWSKLRALDLRMTPNLERLKLNGCDDLTDIHAPAGCLEKLVDVDLRSCSRFGSSLFVKQLKSPELLSLPKLEVKVESLPRSIRNFWRKKLSFTCVYVEEQASLLDYNHKSVCLDLQPGTKLESVYGSFFGLQHLRHLTFDGPIPELPNDLDRLAYLEELKLVSTDIKCLPDSICMLKLLKSLKLQSCRRLKKLPKDLGQLDCLEKLILIECESLKDIPNSICNVKDLRYLYLTSCTQVENLPEELGSLGCLEELDIKFTGIRRLPQRISLLEGLRIVGSVELLQSCAAFATEIEMSEELGTFCYIDAGNSPPSHPQN